MTTVAAPAVSCPVRRWLAFAALGALLLLASVGALSVGAIPVSFAECCQILFGFDLGAAVTPQQFWVVETIRLPRLLQGLLVGAALGISGAAMQGLFRNPLVEPSLLGVSSGAALMAVVTIVFGAVVAGWLPFPPGRFLLPLTAFVGGLLATLLAYRLSRGVGQANITLLILAGVAVNAFAGALVGLVIFYADDRALRDFTFWSLGDLGGANWTDLAWASPWLLLATLGLLRFAKALNAFSLGESAAFHLGLEVERVKLRVIVLSALAVGTAVSLSGIIGFVGLVVPHAVRFAVGADHRLVLPAAGLGGAVLLVLADLVARTVVAPAELPIGVVTALLGAPFFLFLLLKEKVRLG